MQKGKLSVAVVVVNSLAFAALAADWTVSLGTAEAGRTVTESATYDNITTSEKIIVKGGAKLATGYSEAVYFTVAADAVASGGIVDAARIEANSTLAPAKFRNLNANPARITFAGEGAMLAVDRTHWYLTLFASGSAILQDETGDGIRVAQTTDYGCSGHTFNTDGVSVRFLGAGDVTFSRKNGWTDARQSWTFCKGMSIETTKGLYLTSQNGGTYSIGASGVVADSVTGITVSGPANSATENAACYLNVNSGATLRAKNLTATLATRGRVLGSGTVEMGADDSSGTFDALVRGNALTLKKIGSGTLTLGSAVTNIPTLNVTAGTVQTAASFPIGSLSIAEGASLIVDGAEIVLGAADSASLGRITIINGGRVVAPVVDVPDGSKVELRDAIPDNCGIEYVQTGSGTSVVFGATCPAATLHAKDGAIRFSAYGITDRFLRFTFRRTWGWVNYQSVRQAPDYLTLVEFGFYDPSGSRIFSDSDNVYDVSSIDAGSKKPEGLTGLCAMAQAGTVFGTGNTHKSMIGLFNHRYEGWYPYFQTVKLDDTAFAAGEFERFYFHSRTTDPTIHGYNMASPIEKALPRTWTIEASPDGTDDSWYVVSDVADYHNGFFRDEGWLNGVRYDGTGKNDQGLCMVFTNYVSAGVSPNAQPIAVEVENGATIDFASVTGGQPINRIKYDLTTGGGTVNAARLAAEGVFELSAKPAKYGDLALKLTNAEDAANLTDWTVMAGDKVLTRKLNVGSDGTVGFVCSGMLMILR